MEKDKRGTVARPAHSRRALAKPAWVLVLAMACCTGCSFWHFKGSGPVAKDTAYRLHGRAPWTLTESQKAGYEHQFNSTAWQAIAKESFALHGQQAIFKQSTRRYMATLPILGYWPTHSLIALDKKEGTERMAGHAGGFLPFFPVPAIWTTLWDTWYSVDRREELATRKYIGLGPAGILFGYTRTVQPAAVPQIVGNCCHTGPATLGRYLATVVASGEDPKYNSQWGWHIAGGALAWGRVNYHYVLQVAWLPISLWRIRE
jgi:hypothetical protein